MQFLTYKGLAATAILAASMSTSYAGKRLTPAANSVPPQATSRPLQTAECVSNRNQKATLRPAGSATKIKVASRPAAVSKEIEHLPAYQLEQQGCCYDHENVSK